MMNDALEGAEQDADRQVTTQNEDVGEPQFGLIDVVEAFTALRHEYRSQARETRALSEQLEISAQRIFDLESNLSSCAPGNATESQDAGERDESLLHALIEVDVQLSRAADVALHEEQLQRKRQQERHQNLREIISNQSVLARWFARPIITAVENHFQDDSSSANNISDGLSILLTKLRRTLQDRGVQRIDAFGKQFDGECMQSIGVFAVEGIDSGHVSQQLSPAYRRNETIIRFADVRVAP